MCGQVVVPAFPKGAEQAVGAGGYGRRRRPWRAIFNEGSYYLPYCEAVMAELQTRMRSIHPSLTFSISLNNDIKRSNNDLKKSQDTIKDGTEDANHNGKIDGDNGDGLLSDSETWTETNPNSWDTDQDSIRDQIEKQYGYNPLSDDTDGDGLNETEEDVNSNGQRDGSETSALLYDTDKDGLSDSFEKSGWTVLIIYEATLEEKSNYEVSCDPLDEDSDDDGISDMHEFENGTDPNKADTDGDGFTDKYEIDHDIGSSPTGIDGKPPTITDFKAGYELEMHREGLKLISEYKVNIFVSVADVFGIEWINVHMQGCGDKRVVTGDVTSTSNAHFEFTLSLEKAVSSLFNSFGVNITASDQNGNRGFNNYQTSSISNILINNFLGLLKLITKYVSDPREMLIDLIDIIFPKYLVGIKVYYENIFDYSLMDIINNLKIDPVLKRIINQYNIIKYTEGLLENIFKYLYEIIIKYMVDIYFRINNELFNSVSSILAGRVFTYNELLNISENNILVTVYNNVEKVKYCLYPIINPVIIFIRYTSLKLSYCINIYYNIIINILEIFFPTIDFNQLDYDYGCLDNLDFNDVSINKNYDYNVSDRELTKGEGLFLIDNWLGNILFGKENNVTHTCIYIDYTISFSLAEYSVGLYISCILGGELNLWIYGNRSEGFVFIPSIYFVVSSLAVEWAWHQLLIPLESIVGLFVGGLNIGLLIADGYDITGISIQLLIYTRGVNPPEKGQAEWWNIGTSIPVIPPLKALFFIIGRHNIFGKGAKQYNV